MKSTSSRIRKFKMMTRIGVPQSDWVGGRAWGSPVVPLAPPRQSDSRLSLNIDTYLTYVDKKQPVEADSTDYKNQGISNATTCNNAC
tara:strand:+ start:3406 stop:3666 length:261 start_codon:yes stop_codon:yes gene_type:complete